MKRWEIVNQLAASQQPRPLHELLAKQWLLPRRFVHYLRTRRNVLVNGQYRPVNTVVGPGDQVTLRFIGDEFRTGQSSYIPATHPQLTVLFETRDLLVVNKPAGQKCHPNYHGETGTVMNDAAGYLAGSGSEAFMVHRIDQQTSGALIIAKNPVVVPILDRLISANRIHRTYLALAEGRVSPANGSWRWSIGRDRDDKRKRQVGGVGAQSAWTDYQTLAANEQATLLKLSLHTGRTHQLRVHLAYDRHPIIGDPLYNPRYGQPPLLLHGAWLRLVIPFSQEEEIVQAPIANYFQQSLLKYHIGKV
ncbi:RluA family pseudouridine synthase [uncultured Limosilactobacillus sp.]|uniref:RluA family pseudouridine synthase n=1 Tax=uncultured Limosilactobacillus sp. TaxID=2837629 RepID=UPI0025CE1A94|nr:RluA family pseudouridine synthase [uncultured Limosilactobacillus sp.]